MLPHERGWSCAVGQARPARRERRVLCAPVSGMPDMYMRMYMLYMLCVLNLKASSWWSRPVCLECKYL